MAKEPGDHVFEVEIVERTRWLVTAYDAADAVRIATSTKMEDRTMLHRCLERRRDSVVTRELLAASPERHA